MTKYKIKDGRVDDYVPSEIRGWNWGAFGLNWIWGLGNGTYIALLALIPIVNLVMIFVLGAKGNEWAWKNKHWASVEHFKNTQRRWRNAWLILLVTIVVIIIAFAASNNQGASYSSPTTHQSGEQPAPSALFDINGPQSGSYATIQPSQDEARCQVSYAAWQQQYAGSASGNSDVGLGAHYSVNLDICLIEEHYTRYDGMEMYDVFNAAKVAEDPLPKILELDIESPATIQNEPGLLAEALYENGIHINTSNPTVEYNQLKAALFTQ